MIEVKMSKKSWQYHGFTELLRVPILFYKTIGEDLYEHRCNSWKISLLFKILFYAGFINFNVLVAGEVIYFLKALQNIETILEATAVAPCIGFSFVADFKQVALAANKKLLRQLLDDLEDIYPASRKKQLEYKLPRYAANMRLVMIVFSFLCLAYTSTFSLYPICKSFVQYYLLGAPEFERNFGFFIWYPYNATQDRLTYGVTYASQVHGAYLAGVAFLSADLILVALVTLICMHFNYISDCLENCQNDDPPKTEREKIDFLQQLIKHHAKCLELSEHVNSMFGFSLLLNFLTASLTICFIGFQVTASSLEDIIKYIIFLVASMVQVFVICYYGDELITAVISMSYQFFALLRTTYYEN